MKKEKIKISTAKKIHFADILNLLDRLAYEHNRRSRFYKSPGKIRESNARMLKSNFSQADAIILIAVEGNLIVGCFIGDIRDGGRHIVPDEYAHIGSVYILPMYRKKGILWRFRQRFKTWMRKRGVKDCMLMVDSKNKQAIRAWKKVGFEINLHRMYSRI